MIERPYQKIENRGVYDCTYITPTRCFEDRVVLPKDTNITTMNIAFINPEI